MPAANFPRHALEVITILRQIEQELKRIAQELPLFLPYFITGRNKRVFALYFSEF